MIIDLNWSDFKELVTIKTAYMQYEESESRYRIFFQEGNIFYETVIFKDLTDVEGVDSSENDSNLSDFEDNYKLLANQPLTPVDQDGKPYVRSEPRPIRKTGYFCGRSDNGGIGTGKRLFWDFSNEDDIISAPDSNTKIKRLEFSFVDPVNIRGGRISYQLMSTRAMIDMYVVCPAGNYYYKNNGTPAYAFVDTPISHYVSAFQCHDTGTFFIDSQTASPTIPSNYKFWIDITTENTDTTGHGGVCLFIYRDRTVELT